ncbi:hypothetical protein COCC4DRAFT_32794 [Bipolaris maydis ATCC 48331]|uniref:Uncharacterized protein n=2 Tax=Cochliobolus heterostrophus TaxID=5016 RepID=M2UG13_COCH5|nr:uncharacterized protein COCC4DRAFT_32794 [Bipolaris maydis ATCC 48331]EMD86918.1 hypothetical protein COCHEDRAFT_1023704 [Bipolaris maydis C5]ENI04086.1 hypothetical protein COCC4DRAFT_32794 [Bipolaris maydis ATCC 48331]
MSRRIPSFSPHSVISFTSVAVDCLSTLGHNAEVTKLVYYRIYLSVAGVACSQLPSWETSERYL